MSLSSLWPHRGARPKPPARCRPVWHPRHADGGAAVRSCTRDARAGARRERLVPMTTPDAQPTSGPDHGDHGDPARTAHGTRHEHGRTLRDDESVWDARYAELDQVWSGNPNLALTVEVEGTAPGRALEVGCGEGADAVWLATQGWAVTALDPSGVALARARAAAEAAGADVTWLQARSARRRPAGGRLRPRVGLRRPGARPRGRPGRPARGARRTRSGALARRAPRRGRPRARARARLRPRSPALAGRGRGWAARTLDGWTVRRPPTKRPRSVTGGRGRPATTTTSRCASAPLRAAADPTSRPHPPDAG